MKSEGVTFEYQSFRGRYDKIRFNKVNLEVLAVKTPGHTPGSVSFFVDEQAICFQEIRFSSVGLGRPDLGNKVQRIGLEI